jgi:hypothetical protein
MMSVVLGLAIAPHAQARIKRIDWTRKAELAFDGRTFGDAGAFEKWVGVAFGEVDPNDPHNAIIQDLDLAPRNAEGKVEYKTDVYVLKPVDMTQGNGMLLYAVANRGAKGGIPFNIGVFSRNQFNQIVPGGNDPFDAGDGFLEKMGYTVVWSGWQPDVLPGNGRMTAGAPPVVAKNRDGTEITGIVRSELSLAEGVSDSTRATVLNLSSGRSTLLNEASYEPVSLDNLKRLAKGFLPTLTQRRHVDDAREPIDNKRWSFLPCTPVPPGNQLRCQISFPEGFQPGVLYELIYMAKNPTVLGLGWAAQRDLVSFFKHEQGDAGKPNPLFVAGKTPLAVVQGISQSGRAIRTFLHLGFNEDEQGRIVFEGAFPQIGGGRVPMNVRFAAPARGWGYSIDHLYPAYEFPFSYMPTHDPITHQTAGVLDRCLATETCPRIFHVASALELWEGRQSLGFTDTTGKRDLGEAGFIRHYIMASTEHSPPAFDRVKGTPFADCEQQQNPNPQTETLRALWVAFTEWVRDGVHPPPSSTPRIREGTLVTPAEVKFPKKIPANSYPNQQPAGPGGPTPRPEVRFLHLANGLHPLDFGPQFNPEDESGIITIEPPAQSDDAYGILVPQVDADGNDLAGIRSVTVRVPLATYTGWNMGRPGRFEDGLCPVSGSYIPFAPTEAQRVPGDLRPSIQARYGDHAGYVAAVRAAAADLVSQRFLLPEDAERLIAEAEAGGVLR